jgi:hypothetical protein
MQQKFKLDLPQGEAFAFEDDNNRFYFVMDAYVDLPTKMCVWNGIF